MIASYKHASLLDLVLSDEGKKFYDTSPRLKSLREMETWSTTSLKTWNFKNVAIRESQRKDEINKLHR